jgi:hypothetical protein
MEPPANFPSARIGVLRLAAILFIYLGTTIAWMILGGTVDSRTHSSDYQLHDRVGSTWGTPHEQAPPSASFDRGQVETLVTQENGRNVERTVKSTQTIPVPLEGSKIDVRLDLEHRQKGLMWYATYTVGFSGSYQFRNPSDKEEHVLFNFPFPAANALYDDLQMNVNGKPEAFTSLARRLTCASRINRRGSTSGAIVSATRRKAGRFRRSRTSTST